MIGAEHVGHAIIQVSSLQILAWPMSVFLNVRNLYCPRESLDVVLEVVNNCDPGS